MKLYRGKIQIIAKDIVDELTKSKAIEVKEENKYEVYLDVESVLKEYLRTDREISEEARDIMQKRHESYDAFRSIKREIARKHHFGLGFDSIKWISTQTIEVLLHSIYVEEVWAEDRILRRKIKTVLEKHMNEDQRLDQAVRKQIKNLDESSNDWEIQYQLVMERLKRSKGLK